MVNHLLDRQVERPAHRLEVDPLLVRPPQRSQPLQHSSACPWACQCRETGQASLCHKLSKLIRRRLLESRLVYSLLELLDL